MERTVPKGQYFKLIENNNHRYLYVIDGHFDWYGLKFEGVVCDMLDGINCSISHDLFHLSFQQVDKMEQISKRDFAKFKKNVFGKLSIIEHLN